MVLIIRDGLRISIPISNKQIDEDLLSNIWPFKQIPGTSKKGKDILFTHLD